MNSACISRMDILSKQHKAPKATMTDITQFTCPHCYHERFTPANDGKTSDSIVGACCLKCHYVLNANDVEQFDRLLARKMLRKIIDV